VALRAFFVDLRDTKPKNKGKAAGQTRQVFFNALQPIMEKLP